MEGADSDQTQKQESQSPRQTGDGQESTEPPVVTPSSDIATAATADTWRPNLEILQQLEALGFERSVAEKALRYGSNQSVDQAINWIFDSGLCLNDAGATFAERPERPAEMPSYKMVFVVNSMLKMGVGKVAAQVGHATLGLFRELMERPDAQQQLMQWDEDGEMKIVLRADGGEQELINLRTKSSQFDGKVHSYLVADAGRTQIAAGSFTVLSVFGPTNLVDQITGHLKLL